MATLFEHLHLRHIRLIDLVSHLEIRDGKIPSFAAIESAATVGQSPDGRLIVDMTLNLKGRPADAEAESSSVVIDVHYQCVYDIADAEANQFKPFAAEIAKVGMLILWPHVRELVQSVTSRMSLPAFVLPVFSPSDRGEGEASVREIRIRKNGK